METVHLVFEELGNPDHAPLLILHGFFASMRNWRNIAEKLAETHHVFVVDQRNHGASPHHAIMDYPIMASDLLQFVKVHTKSKINLLGHSMGGKVAMWFALNYPEKIDKLIIADIAPKTYQHSFDNYIEALKALPLDKISSRKQADEILANAITDQAYRQFLLQNLVLKEGRYSWRVNLDIFQSNAANIIAFPDSKHLSPFTGNTLFIAGEQSNFVKQGDIDLLFPNASFCSISNAAHWLHVQQPAIFLSELENFLQSIV